MKKMYECSKCGEKFYSEEACKKHEEECSYTKYFKLFLKFYVMKDSNKSWDPYLTICAKKGKAPDWGSIKEDHEDAYDYDDDYLRSVTLTAYAENKDDIKPAYSRLTKAFEEYQQSYMKSLTSTFSTDLESVKEKDPMEELNEED